MNSSTAHPSQPLSLHTFQHLRRATAINTIFAIIYGCAILALLYHHALTLLHSITLASFSISILLLTADIILSLMWLTTQAFRLHLIVRQVFPENVKKKVADPKDFPGLDIIICTADPYKEPPISVVNTALSVMAYDYPMEKVSVYVSDDGGSELTLFAFMEAAKFGSHWLPFCRENQIMERCPEVYFSSNESKAIDAQQIKIMYERMRTKVEDVVQRGKVGPDYVTNEQDLEPFTKWTDAFTRQQHPAVIEVLLEAGKDKDITGRSMPNLIYVSREKNKAVPHYFKAGALNALLRVSAVMTNAPIILNIDCDMYSNDPQTLYRMLCYFLDPSVQPKVSYVQFPQRFVGLNDTDIYASIYKRPFKINARGLDGLYGPDNFGSGTFFNRRAFFGGPKSFVSPELMELSPNPSPNEPIKSQAVLKLAHFVAGCNYEHQTNWGSKIGFRYGSLVEDYFTGYMLHCEGWKSIFCDPERPAFLAGVPISLIDVLNQAKRWSVGLLEVAFSKYSPATFGVQAINLFAGLCYSHYAFEPLWCIPTAIYAFLPQLAILNNASVFPEISDPWFFLYMFMFLGGYGKDCIDFISANGNVKTWWSDCRMWLMRGLSSYLFATIEYGAKLCGIATQGFVVTNKVVDDEQSKRYDQGIFEFGVESPMFIPLAMAAIINLAAFLRGLLIIFKGENLDGLLLQMALSGFGVSNCWPFYGAMLVRTDKGKIPLRITLISLFFAGSLYMLVSLVVNNEHV